MASELTAFAKIAIYLKDPLVLSGFVIFIGFLALRQLLRSGVVPVLQQGQGFKILRLVFSYGFILGLLIVLLGMGLKYREMSEVEQKRTAALITNELESDYTVVSELGKNTETLTRLGQGLATILRDQRIKILSGLFAPQNIDTTIDEGLLTNLYVEKIEWFADSKIWDDFNERRRAEEACAAIIRFVERTRSAVESLGDTQGQRYKIESRTYDANLDILRKIAVVDVSQLANLYHRMNDARVLYNRIVAGSLEYMLAVRQFCAALPPDRSTLGSALALERLTFRMLPSYRQKIDDLLTVIKREIEQLQQA